MTNDNYRNVADAAWNLSNEPDTDFTASVTLRDCAITIKEMQSRIAELESRLEIDERHPIDGISARDATIKALDERIAELEKDAARYRWLKAEGEDVDVVRERSDIFNFEWGDELDAAIDAAMQGA